MRNNEQDEAPYGRSPLTGRPYTRPRVEGAKHVVDHELHLQVIERVAAMGREETFRAATAKKLTAKRLPTQSDLDRTAAAREFTVSRVKARNQSRFRF